MRVPQPRVRWLAASGAMIALAWGSYALLVSPDDTNEVQAAEPAKAPPPQVLFELWPQKGAKAPEVALVISGQMYGYLQKCGCSNPQLGGIERRYNFIQSLKAKGWKVIGVDLGDVPHSLPYTPTLEQTLTKYEVAMTAMKMMGYQVTAVGREELKLPLLSALSKYSLQKGNELPRVHAGNITNPQAFPDATGKGSCLTASGILTEGDIRVGVVSVAGQELIDKNIDRTVEFGNTGQIVKDTLAAWNKLNDKTKPNVRVLLYQGPYSWKDAADRQIDAQTAAKAFPEFNIIVCLTEDGGEAVNVPIVVNEGRTMILKVGKRGQNVGVVGAYQGEKGVELYYQRVAMADEFNTPEGQEKNHPILKMLQEYSDTVRDNDYLSEMAKRKKLHATQALPNMDGATYMGDQECMACHQNEHAVWGKSKHADAYNALAKKATKPVGRQFDGECIICHTVGYDLKSGYVNEKTTPHLKNVQCEACHGPASLHVAEERANLKAKRPTHAMAAPLVPWRAGGKNLMPSADKMEALAKAPEQQEKILTPAESQVYLRVYQICAKCHDPDNDPHFNLAKYWKDIVHTGLANKKPGKK